MDAKGKRLKAKGERLKAQGAGKEGRLRCRLIGEAFSGTFFSFKILFFIHRPLPLVVRGAEFTEGF